MGERRKGASRETTRIRGWDDVARLLGGPPSQDLAPLWRARLTMAASLAYGLSSLPDRAWQRASGGSGAEGRILVWIVGAREPMEGELVRQGMLAEAICGLWERARNHGLDLVLCGPEMRDWTEQIDHSSQTSGAQVPATRVRAVCGTLHACLEESSPTGDVSPLLAQWPPDAAVCFNSGVGTLLAPLVSPWLPTLTKLLSTGAPVLMTCYSAHEVSGESAILPMLGANTLLASIANPLAHVVSVEILEISPVDDHVRAAWISAEINTRAAVADETERRDPDVADYSPHGLDTQRSGSSWLASSKVRLDVANQFMCCIRGERNRSPTEMELGIRKAEELLTSSAQLFAVKRNNAASWVACLAPEIPLETAAANAELIARAAQHPRIALLLSRLGARAALVAAVRRLASNLEDAHIHGAGQGSGNIFGGSTLSYSGAPPMRRLLLSAERAISLIDDAAEMLATLNKEPVEPEMLLDDRLSVQTFDNTNGYDEDAVEAAHSCTYEPSAMSSKAKLVLQAQGARELQAQGACELQAHRACELQAQRAREFTVVFEGSFINARQRPTFGAPVTRRLVRGELIFACAKRGSWLRTLQDDWVLLSHPTLGVLVKERPER